MRAILFSFLFLSFALTSLSQGVIAENERLILEKRGELYFSFIPSDKYPISQIASIVSVDSYTGQGRVFAYANFKEFSRFLALGIDYQLEMESYFYNPPSMATSVDALMQSWDAYPTYYQYDSLMQKLANDYPNLCKYHVLGTLASGRKILALQLGDSVNVLQQKPHFLYTSSMHGNELTGYVLMLRLADYLLTNYGSNPLVDSVMNNVDIWINPLANPDGAYQAGDTTLSGATRYNGSFVDLNRNYPDPEDGQHPDGEQWQDETKIFMHLADSLHFSLSANFHGGAEVVNYPWDTWAKLSADDNWWKYVSHQYADTAQFYSPGNYFIGPSSANGTGVTNGYQWYSVFGGRQDYMNYFQACREFTVELSNNKMPLAVSLPNYWNYNYRSLLQYMNQLRFGLKGRITDSLTNAPLEAMVFINNHDKDSSQVFSHLPNGDYYRLLDTGYYSITFSAEHYYPKTIDSVYITRNQILKLDVQLLPDYTGIYKEQPILYTLYPNPTQGKIHIQSEYMVSNIHIYSLDGRLLRNFGFINQKKVDLDLQDLNEGLYFIVVEFNNAKSSVQKLIIQ